MFGKLMKLELNYLVRKFLPIWVIGLVLTVLNFAVGIGNARFILFDDTMMTIALVLYIAMVVEVIVLAIVSFVQICSRFYKSMFGEEGYLSHTLPVSVDALILSKGLSALLIMTITGIFALLMVGVMATMVQRNLGMAPKEFIDQYFSFGLSFGEWAGTAVWILVLGFVSEIASIFMIYAAIAIGHLWREHPVGGGILAYLAITTVQSVVNGLLGINHVEESIYAIEDALVTISRMSSMQVLLAAAMGVVCYFVTRYIVKNKLNLQ